jgi:hypothetical protein
MAVAWADILQRLKDRLIDANLDQWTEAQLKEWYDQGASLQHKHVLENARKHRAFLSEHPYLRYFKATQTIATVVDTRDYALTAGVSVDTILRVMVPTDRGVAFPARRVPIEDDGRIQRSPRQYGPTPEDALWSITSAGLLRLYVHGDAGKGFPPLAVYNITVDHVRDVTKTTGANVDLLDPWNIGPIAWAMSIAKGMQLFDPDPWRQEAIAGFESILPGPPPPMMRGAA